MASYSSPPNFDPHILLRNCTNGPHLTQIHARIIKSNTNIPYTRNHTLATKLLRLYSSHGYLNYASTIFHQIPNPRTMTWNLIIRAHEINGFSRQSVILYNLMVCKGVPLDKYTFPFVLKACGGIRNVEKGKEVHGFAVKSGFYERDLFVMNTLLDMYLKCGELECAKKVFGVMSVRNVVSWTTMVSGLVRVGEVDSARGVFDQMPERNVVSWSAMINGYVAKGRPQEGFELFREMQEDGVRPNEFTLVSLLRACTELGSVKLGAWVHEFALKNGFGMGVYLGTTLVDMYSKCGSLEEARKVFDMMEERSIATWNSMITSLGVHGCGEEALLLFDRMIEENVQPDAITFVGVLSACIQTNKIDEGLKYFKYMTEEYGIMPISEHYMCMFDLWDRSKMIEHRRSEGTKGFVQVTEVVQENLSVT